MQRHDSNDSMRLLQRAPVKANCPPERNLFVSSDKTSARNLDSLRVGALNLNEKEIPIGSYESPKPVKEFTLEDPTQPTTCTLTKQEPESPTASKWLFRDDSSDDHSPVLKTANDLFCSALGNISIGGSLFGKD